MKAVAAFLVILGACVADVDSLPNDSDYPVEFSEAATTNARLTAFNYFVSKGLTETQSAGIVGNLMQESSVIPTAVEYGGGPGRGIAQWSVGGRWDTSHGDNITAYAAQHGASRWALQTQLDFIWVELTTNSAYGLAQLKAATTITSATYAFQKYYEICGTCAQSKRISYAQAVYNDYHGHGTTPPPPPPPGDPTPPPASTSCASGTLGRDVPENTCVESKFDGAWYQCDNGEWVDRWSDPTACNGVYPL